MHLLADTPPPIQSACLEASVLPGTNETQGVAESQIVCLVEDFYRRVRADALLSPVFASRLDGRWPEHLGKMTDFWSSIALMSGRYSGKPHLAHQGLGLTEAHFERWIELFDLAADHTQPHDAAAFFKDRSRRIRDSLVGRPAQSEGTEQRLRRSA
jgi:hemoglobin